MNKSIKRVLGSCGLFLIILTTGCVANDEYYAETTYFETVPLYGYGINSPAVGAYYKTDYTVREYYWPRYSRPYMQQGYYYYTW